MISLIRYIYNRMISIDYISFFLGKDFKNAMRGPYFESDRYDYPYIEE